MEIPDLLFQGWAGIWRTVLVSVLAYAALVLFLRISGKRTLSKLNAFDFVVTVALGSTLATILLSKDVALAEGLTALGMLIALQFAVTWTAVRSSSFSDLIRSEPTLLARDGALLQGPMKRQRVTEAEVMSAVRDRGGRDLKEVEAVFLESDGTLTALLRQG
jgi:uncharacterized membrane protein YcaP (DUF421 family)